MKTMLATLALLLLLSPLAAEEEKKAERVKTKSGLAYEVITPGKEGGKPPVPGDKVKVHYVGTLPNGNVFDSSRKKGVPFEFILGAGMVIRGWDEGVEGMKAGGRRKLTIPAHLGYGSAGAGGVIPPNAVLVFEVELLDIDG